MAELLQHGQKVKYLYEGKWLKGIIHGVKTHETPDGQITRVAYLIDTGKKTILHADKRHLKTGEVIGTVPYESDQPVQVEVDQTEVRAI